jgi:hypothetical protein
VLLAVLLAIASVPAITSAHAAPYTTAIASGKVVRATGARPADPTDSIVITAAVESPPTAGTDHCTPSFTRVV